MHEASLSPANHHTVVRYSEITGKKREIDFFVTVK